MNKIYKNTLMGIIFIILIGMIFIPILNGQEINVIKKSFEYKNSYNLLIITPDYFLDSITPLVFHKEKYGVITYVATLDEIYSYQNGQWGRDNQEKIKIFIRDGIVNWGIKYVLLVGGKVNQLNRWHLPVRYVYLGNTWESKIISDLYYADVFDFEGNFSSWDSDNDSKFCEWLYNEQPEDKNIDLVPDVSIGRLPCRNLLEVKLAVNRIISYESNNQKNQLWFNNFIVAAGDTYPEKNNPKWVGYEGEYYGDLAIENMTGFNPIKLYASDGSLKSGRDILKKMNEGCGFIYFVGHGCPMLWSNNFPNGTGQVKPFGIFQIAQLKNFNKLPVCIVSGCHNCQFDVTIFNYFNITKRQRAEYPPECWGWQMTRKIGGGSIATIGCIALGHTKEDKEAFNGGINELEVEFFKQYGQNNINVLGDTWINTIKWYINTYKIDWNSNLTNDNWVDIQVPSTWILFGDPSLKIGGYI